MNQQLPTKWPFQFYNNLRTPESTFLLERGFPKKESNVELQRKEDLGTIEEALF